MLIRRCAAEVTGRREGDLGASYRPHRVASLAVAAGRSLRHPVPDGRALGAAGDRLRQRDVLRLDDAVARRHLPVPTVRRRRRRPPQRTVAVRQRPDNRSERTSSSNSSCSMAFCCLHPYSLQRIRRCCFVYKMRSIDATIASCKHRVKITARTQTFNRLNDRLENRLNVCLKPNSITLASSELAPNMFEAGSCQIPLH